MERTIEAFLERLRMLGTLREIRAEVERHGLFGPRGRSNAHIHLPPNFSAFESVAQAVDAARAQGLTVLGASNYYDYSVYADFAWRCHEAGIFPLFGQEIIALVEDWAAAGYRVNDPGNAGRYYFCGKGLTRLAPLAPRAAQVLDGIRTRDADRLAAMSGKLAALWQERGIDVAWTAEELVGRVVRRHGCPPASVVLQERHLCQACQELLFERYAPGEREAALERALGVPSKAGGNPVGVQGEIRTHLLKAGCPAFAEERFVSFDQAFQLILDCGGIPCYPVLADGADPVCDHEATPEGLIHNLKSRNIQMAEWIPQRNRTEVVDTYVTALRAAGFAVVAGTEHNTLDLSPLEPGCLGGAPLSDAVQAIFWEGACVAAAHQFLSLHGECGFVDGTGRPNPAYNTADERIRSLAALGAAVIRRYLESV